MRRLCGLSTNVAKKGQGKKEKEKKTERARLFEAEANNSPAP
jgi:hypothetical protein